MKVCSCGSTLSLKNKHGMCNKCYQASDTRKVVAQKMVAKRRKFLGKDNPNYKGKIEKQCPCGKKLTVFPSHEKTINYCNYSCKYRYNFSRSRTIEYKGFRMRSRWEVAFAEWLDSNKLSWKYESESIPLTKGWYLPDFWVEEWGAFVEVKGYWRADARAKIEEASKIVTVKIVDKQWFLDHGYIVSPRKGVYKENT